jgi:hypothetical protein
MQVEEYPMRPSAEYLPEQAFLRGKVEQIEKALGRVAAKLQPGELSQAMDALDRARELANQMHKQARVRSIESAVDAQKAWLLNARANQDRAATEGEPVMHFNRIELDLRILDEILRDWRVYQQGKRTRRSA